METSKIIINMDDIKNLKELIESKLENLETKIEANHKIQNEISKNILTQTQRTNGRVTQLENDIDKMKDVDNTYRTLECPRIREIEKINNKIDNYNVDMTEFRLIKKYPKITISFIAIAVLIVFLTVFTSFNSLTKKNKLYYDKQNIENIK